jgi:hypothetical protein
MHPSWLQAVGCAEVAWFLIVLGGVLFLLTFGLAFTIYGIFAAVLAVLSLVTGIWMLARRSANRATRT